METIDRAGKGMKEKADVLIALFDKFTKSQRKQQIIIIIITVVIAVSTTAYTWITYKSVSAMHEANKIQTQMLEIEKKKLEVEQTHNKSLKNDHRDAGHPPAP